MKLSTAGIQPVGSPISRLSTGSTLQVVRMHSTHEEAGTWKAGPMGPELTKEGYSDLVWGGELAGCGDAGFVVRQRVDCRMGECIFPT